MAQGSIVTTHLLNKCLSSPSCLPGVVRVDGAILMKNKNKNKNREPHLSDAYKLVRKYIVKSKTTKINSRDLSLKPV